MGELVGFIVLLEDPMEDWSEGGSFKLLDGGVGETYPKALPNPNVQNSRPAQPRATAHALPPPSGKSDCSGSFCCSSDDSYEPICGSSAL